MCRAFSFLREHFDLAILDPRSLSREVGLINCTEHKSDFQTTDNEHLDASPLLKLSLLQLYHQEDLAHQEVS